MNAMDLFSAGSETPATTLAWAVSDINMICVNWIMDMCKMICVNVHDMRDHRHILGVGGEWLMST